MRTDARSGRAPQAGPLVLTKLETCVLSSCEGQNVGARVAREIISRYLGRDVSVREMRATYARLLELDLVEPLTGRHGDRRRALFKGTRTSEFSFRATRKGVLYLKRPSRASTPPLEQP